MLAYKAVKQRFVPTQELYTMMETFRNMVNHCIRVGLENDASALGKITTLCYHDLSAYDIQTKYRLTAISQAAGILSRMKKDSRKAENQNPHMYEDYS